MGDFHSFTTRITNHKLALIVGGVVISAPSVVEALPGRGMICGRYKEAEVRDLIEALETGTSLGFLRLVE